MDTLCKKSFVINPYPYLILGGIQYTSPPIRKSSIPSWWGRFLVTDFFITFYIHTWRILAKSHGCIITTFEIMTAFQRAVLTKSWFYGQNTVQVANTWSSCKIWTNFYNFYCFHCLSNILHCFQTVECQ